jgi:hypothetical protein
MWKRLQEALRRLWRWSNKSSEETRADKARARFWTDLRAGEREAEARSRP